MHFSRFGVWLLASLAFATTVGHIGRVRQNHTSHLNRSPVMLLPGYRVSLAQGIEGGGGRISKKDGPTIEFNIGGYFGNQAMAISPDKLSWRENQTIDGFQFDIAMTEDNLLVMSNQDGDNFSANVKNSQELTEVMLMVVTLNRSEGYPIPPGY